MSRQAQPGETQRVAVVLVHGQGDQRPMRDVLELANSVWETDKRAAPGDQLASIWSVPTEEAEELPDQRRLVSEAVEDRGGRKVQVDFYQFYWAHLMIGNRLIHVWRWLLELFAKKPDQVPEQLRSVREFGMRASLIPIYLALVLCLVSIAQLVVSNYQNHAVDVLRAYFAPMAGMEGRTGAVPSFELAPIDYFTWPMLSVLGWVTLLAAFFYHRGWLRSQRRAVLKWSMVTLLAGVMFWLPAHWNPYYRPDRTDELCYFVYVDAFQGSQGGVDIADLIDDDPALGMWDGDCARDVPAFHGLRLYNLLTVVLMLMIVFVIAGSFALIALNSTFLSPVMADSARYFRPAPENIDARHQIRRAGLRLLERLHRSKRNYSRIIVVGHSLGSVVAYGIIDQMWGRVSGQFSRAAAAAAPALHALEDAARALEDLPHDKPRLHRYRNAQRAYFEALSSVPAITNAEYGSRPWLISDFVTIGSPLTYGGFLMAETDSEFEAQVRKHRRIAVCPPDGDWRAGRWSITYSGASGFEGPHHACVFAPVRWSNIYFKTKGLVEGDIVAGPVAPIFGPGIVDVCCDPKDTGKRFAHNEYWRWPNANPLGSWFGGPEKAFVKPPRYIEMLRRALNLFDDPDSDDLLVEASDMRTPPQCTPARAAG